ncbi:Hypothetical protein, putative [Bodo saltans]|uniref:C5orf34-like C-terminal domain-containing protein n=1 Tax=Bodo saltans TaxID=75058 RepID=A0A0S4JTC4_BODSA|nr:Hypothetical protein, putative [Bodo saltans]|eukprot:CUG92598.1 Hypothetical protein, putative [Bodo saltans]
MLASSSSFLAPIGPQHRAVFNATQYGNHVSKAVHWSDGGSEFVFMDGTVLSFMDHMNTFVAVNPSASPTQRDLMLTSLCLSTYEEKVRAALAVYNRFAVRPRLVHGLCSTQEFIWQKASPIEALVLAKDPSLFSREYVGGAHQNRSISTAPPLAHCTLWCAMRKVRLTLHASGQGFQVAWPAKVSETDGSTTVFVPPINEHGEYRHALASQRAYRYVVLEQWFWIEQCPSEWSEMVRLCLELDRLVPHFDAHQSTNSSSSRSHYENNNSSCTPTTTTSLSTPTPLGAPRLPPGLSSYLSDRNSLATSKYHQHQQARFSELQVDDGHSFIASTQVQSCPAQKRLHPLGSAHVVWRWDSDPSGRTPNAFFHSWEVPQMATTGGSNRSNGPNVSGTPPTTVTCCAAFVLEDDAVVIGVESNLSSIVRLQLQRALLQVAPPSSAPAESPPTTADALVALETREYMQDAALSLALPKSINSGFHVPVLGSLGAAISQQSSQQHQQHPGVSLEFGRYLPSVAESIVAIVRRNQKAQHLPTSSTAHASSSSSLSSQNQQLLDTSETTHGRRAVKLTTRVDNVGTFTALTNGVCRAVFDDRVIVTLIPDAHDSDEGLVCEMRGRDGTLRAMRVSQCVNTHEVFDYLAYLLPFRNFARLSEEDQRHLALTMPPAQRYERMPIFAHDAAQSASLAAESSSREQQRQVPSSYWTSNGAYTPSHHQPSSVDVVMLSTSGTLMRSEASRTRARQLLQDLAY